MPTTTKETMVEPQFIDRRKYDRLRDHWMDEIVSIFARSLDEAASDAEPVVEEEPVSFDPLVSAQPVFKPDDSHEHVPIHQKMTLTIREAAEYSNIGINRIDNLLRTPNCPFVLYVGTKKLVKRREFEQFISTALVI